MKKNTLIIFIVILVVIIAAAVFFMYNQSANWRTQDLSKISDKQVISMLNKNTDAKEYMQNHPDFKIEKKEIMTIKSITDGQNGANFREVYRGLELQENRYMLVNLSNTSGDRGLIAVLDFKTNQAIRAYGLLLLKGSSQ